MQLRTRRHRGRDEKGATFVLVAVSMVLLLWGGAFGVDLGITAVGNRQVQSMADTAGLDLARYVDVADWTTTIRTAQQSTNFLNVKMANANTDNGSGVTLSEIPGVWLNGSFTPEGQKVGNPPQFVQCWFFTPPALHPCNAVKVTATQSVPQIFVGGQSHVSRSAIAAVTPEAAFSVGSYLASINSQESTVLNAIMSTLGGTANVTALGYQGLANTNVTINQLITASGGLLTTSNVLTASLPGSTWQSIWNVAVANQVAQANCGATPTPLPCLASSALSGTNALNFTASTQAQLCQLVSINGSTCSSGTLSTAALSTSLNALQTFTTEAEVANGTHALDLGTSLGITGVSDAKLTLTLTQLPQVAFGAVGATATTAQVSSDLQLSVLGIGLVDIPLSAAQGTGTLQGLTCSFNSMKSTTIQPTSTTVQGTVNVAGVNVGTLSVSGITSQNTSAFGYGPSVVPPSASTAQAGTNPQAAGATNPTLSYTGLTVTNPSPLYTLLTSTLQGVLGSILQVAGAAVGGVQVADLGTNCGAVSLVQ